MSYLYDNLRKTITKKFMSVSVSHTPQKDPNFVEDEIIETPEKVINKERTKGGYAIQYWGEQLTTIGLSGTTGSSGVEGLNVLHEIYRSEQFVFDNYGLVLASQEGANNFSVGAGVEKAGQAVGAGGIGGVLGTIADVLTGPSDPNKQLLPQQLPTLASLAFTVEMFYEGWVYRGYFDSIRFTESVDYLGSFEYDIQFVATQKRGYRLNTLPWQKSAIYGPSDSTNRSARTFK
jgi:hypothetical protein